MGARSHSRWFRILALGLGIAAGLALIELALRLAGRPPTDADILATLSGEFEPPQPSADCRAAAEQARLREIVEPTTAPDLVYQLRPGVDTCFEGARVRINAQRVRRDTDMATPKPADTFRILVLGDSHAFGWAIPAADTVSAQLEAALGARTRARVEAVNAGVPGYSAYQEAAWLDAHGSEFEPDCVLVLFVANDMGLPHFLLRPRVSGPSRLLDRVRAATASKRWFHFAPNELATFVSEVEMDRIPQRYRHMVGEDGYRRALEKIAARARQGGFDLVNVFDYSTLDVDAAALIDFQESLGFSALEMPWPGDPSFRVSATDPHLNQAGNAAIVEFLLSRLTERSVCLPPPIEVPPS